jgi:hypothetical protein
MAFFRLPQKRRSLRSPTNAEDNDGWKQANQQKSRCYSRANLLA